MRSAMWLTSAEKSTPHMESVIGYGKPQLLRICAVVGKTHGVRVACAWRAHGTCMPAR